MSYEKLNLGLNRGTTPYEIGINIGGAWTPIGILPTGSGETSGMFSVTDISALRSFNPAISTQVYLQGYSSPLDGGGGVFKWESSNYSALVAEDPYMGVYVPPSGGNGSAGAWVRVDNCMRAAHFGIKNDGSANTAARFNSMFALNDGRNLPCIVGAGTYKIDATLSIRSNLTVMFDRNAVMSRAFNSGAMVDAVGASALSNVYFAGGQWGQSLPTYTGPCLNFWLNDSIVENVTVIGWVGGLAFLWCGDRFIINNIKATNTTIAAGNGGIRFIGGNDSYAYGCYVESGDDALQFVPAPAPLVSPTPQTDMSIRNCWYINCYGKSGQGRGMIVNMRAPVGYTMTASIRDSGFISTLGVSPQDGGQPIGTSILVYNANSTGNIDGIRFIGCSVDVYDNVNSTAAIWLLNDGTSGGKVRNIRGDVIVRNTVGQALVVDGVDNVKLDIYSDIPTTPASANAGDASVYVTNSTNVYIGGKIGVAANQTQCAFGVAGTSGRVYLKDASVFGFQSATSTFSLVNLSAGTDCGLDNVRFEAAAADSYSRILVGAGMTYAYINADVSQLGFSSTPYSRISNSGTSTRVDPSCIGLGIARFPVALSITSNQTTPDLLAGQDFTLSVTATTQFQIPTRQVKGQRGFITITQDASGHAVTFVSAYNGSPSVSTTANAVTYLEYYVADVNTIRIWNI